MILLTGATGYLGKELTKILDLNSNNSVLLSSQEGNDYRKCDLTDPDEVASLAKEIDPELIIHCAASVPKTMNDYSKSSSHLASHLMSENLEKFFNTRIINISSMTVYADSDFASHPASEKKTRNVSTNQYAKYKLESEFTFASSKNLDAISLRLPGIFSIEREQGIIYEAVKAFSEGSNLDLDKKLPFWSALHLQDAAIAIEYFSKNFDTVDDRVINVGYPGKQSIPRIIELIASIFGKSFCHDQLVAPDFEMDLEIFHKYFQFDNSSLEKRIRSFVISFQDKNRVG